MRAILTYHSLDSSGSAISIDDSIFRRHMHWLASSSVAVRSLGEILTEPPGRPAAAVTFDDGFVNFEENAWPVLQELGFPVVLFVATDHVGGLNAWPAQPKPAVPELPLLGWESIGRLAEQGVEIGSHSRTHRALTLLDDAQLEEELLGSAERIRQETGVRPGTFAYPFGRVDARSARAVAKAYALACTTDLRPLGARETAHLVPRLDAYYFRTRPYLESWGSRRLRARLMVRRLARRIRGRLESPGCPRRRRSRSGDRPPPT